VLGRGNGEIRESAREREYSVLDKQYVGGGI